MKVILYYFSTLICAFFLGCGIDKPPPGEIDSWHKDNFSKSEVFKALVECGFGKDQIYGTGSLPLSSLSSTKISDQRWMEMNRDVESEQCMLRNGYKTNYSLCSDFKNLPACLNHRK